MPVLGADGVVEGIVLLGGSDSEEPPENAGEKGKGAVKSAALEGEVLDGAIARKKTPIEIVADRMRHGGSSALVPSTDLDVPSLDQLTWMSNLENRPPKPGKKVKAKKIASKRSETPVKSIRPVKITT